MVRPSLLRVTIAAVVLAGLAACDQYAVAADPSASHAATPELTPVPSEADPAASCSVGAIAEGSAAEVLRAGTGCLSVDRAVLVRCDPSGPPAIAVDASDDPRTFLGGPYAVALDARPVPPEVLGMTTAGRVWRSTTDPKRLFVESSGGWDRWLALAAPDDLAPSPSVFMIGDSILDGAREAVIASLPGWDVTIDAEVGRGSSTAADIAGSMTSPPDVLVVQIGSNDHDPSGFAAAAERVFASSAGTDLVVWVTVHSPDSSAVGINAAIRSAVGRVPQALIADWNAFVPAEALNEDGIHLAPGSEHVMADLLASILNGWRAAVAGSATECLAPAG